MNMIGKIAISLAFLCAATVANAQTAKQGKDPSLDVQVLETLKQSYSWSVIKGNFANKSAFFNAAVQGFQTYFRKYSPSQYSRDEESLVMVAKYGDYNVKCTFFKDSESQYVVVIETDLEKSKIKWLKHVVKEVEKFGK